ncbi:MAG: penicillin-binding protein 2 [Gammaproteobacteria bacterium]|jgi:cell division protein FtsI (penicillin-binding protein 3)|nr:penicillin-binding protein 2 [Gammaproteobacteria bacterium]
MIFKRVQNYRTRQSLVKYLFYIFVFIFVYRSTTIHSNELDEVSFLDKASSKSIQTMTEKAIRGNILDRNGNILAIDLIKQRINIDPSLVQDEYVTLLAQALSMPNNELKEILEKKKLAGRRYLIIKKNLAVTDPIFNKISELKRNIKEVCASSMVDQENSWIDRAKSLVGFDLPIKDKVEEIKCSKRKIAGVFVETESFRYYPKNESLATLLGKVNEFNYGAFGVEKEFDRYLAGRNGKKRLADDKSNSDIYYDAEIIDPLEHGDDIQLTIDADIQFHLYNAIKNSAEFHEAESASAIVLAPNGEILALANYPSANPNDRQNFDAEGYRNRVLADKIEPGSTMKPFTMLLALDKGVISATDDELIDVTERIGNIRPDEKYTEMTVKLILQKSHNLGTINISERLENEDFFDAWSKLGFGDSLGLMPSIENPGILRHSNSWGLADKRSLSFGHGPMNTNLAQLARAYLVFANEGALPELKLVKNNSTIDQKQQVFSPESTKRIAEILDSVASMEGSGYRAIIDGYDIAGKTGTAEIVIDGKYNKDGAKRTYFVGFSPVINPKYIIAVRLDHPKQCFASWDPTLKIRCEGSNSASMAFRDAMEQILNNDLSLQPKSDS